MRAHTENNPASAFFCFRTFRKVSKKTPAFGIQYSDSKWVAHVNSVTVFTTTCLAVAEIDAMFKHIFSKLMFSGLLLVSALAIPGCQNASGGKPEWLTGSEGVAQSSCSRFDPANYSAALKNPARTKTLQAR